MAYTAPETGVRRWVALYGRLDSNRKARVVGNLMHRMDEHADRWFVSSLMQWSEQEAGETQPVALRQRKGNMTLARVTISWPEPSSKKSYYHRWTCQIQFCSLWRALFRLRCSVCGGPSFEPRLTVPSRTVIHDGHHPAREFNFGTRVAWHEVTTYILSVGPSLFERNSHKALTSQDPHRLSASTPGRTLAQARLVGLWP